MMLRPTIVVQIDKTIVLTLFLFLMVVVLSRIVKIKPPSNEKQGTLFTRPIPPLNEERYISK